MNSPRVGFIGLGDQGAPMADRILAAGMPLTVWARRTDVTAPFVAKGAVAATSMTGLGERCDHVGLCVTSDDGVLEVAGRLIPAMHPGSRIAIHATVLPQTVINLDRACAARGIDLIDAPVAGGRAGAEAGTLTVMCGASSDAFAAALPVLETFGRTIMLMGPAGSGQRAKIIVNAMASAHFGIAMAALETARTFELDHDLFTNLVAHSGGKSFAFEIFAKLTSPTDFGHRAAHLVKDMEILEATLPGDPAVALFAATADQFLRAATAAPATV